MAKCYSCKDSEGELIDGLCVVCYGKRQEAIFRQVFGDDVVDKWQAEDNSQKGDNES